MSKNRLVVIGAVVLAGVLGCCVGAGSTTAWNAIFRGTPSVPLGNADRQVTLKHFKEIPDEATYGQVVRIIGFEGKQFARDLIRERGRITQAFIWSNADGSNLTCEFDQEVGLLVSKTQQGLR